MPAQTGVSRHYAHGSLTDAIRDGLASLGKGPGIVFADDLAPVDEFHIGGRKASEDFLDQLGFSADKHVLDVGCDLGGAARFVASRYGSRVTGLDLTSEYVETRKALCKWVGSTTHRAASRQRAGDAVCRQPVRWRLHASCRDEYRGHG
jgi:2-polyprenyl-3-methyl-5-hydroxy-6-metoxy-1,4-benzoquinol methylase